MQMCVAVCFIFFFTLCMPCACALEVSARNKGAVAGRVFDPRLASPRGVGRGVLLLVKIGRHAPSPVQLPH